MENALASNFMNRMEERFDAQADAKANFNKELPLSIRIEKF